MAAPRPSRPPVPTVSQPSLSPSDAELRAHVVRTLEAQYEVGPEIGRGGMGIVYRGRDLRLKREVAIKVLPPELAFRSEIRSRFLREAEMAAQLGHPHIVPIYSVDEREGLVYFVMALVEGGSLATRVGTQGALAPDEVRRILIEVGDALAYAHARNTVHRDIKPDNILLDGARGRVMVTDFGIAKAFSGATGNTLTGAGVAIGTPQFMSPEQAAGERALDGRSDIYSLGVVGYQMLTGELPFTAPTVAGILMKQITEPAPVLHETRQDIPEDLSLTVARCLEKDPEGRWPSADALRRALETRNTGGWRPTGQAAASPAAPRTTTTARTANTDRPATAPRPAGRGLVAPARPRPSLAERGGTAPRWVRNDRGEWVRSSDIKESGLLRDTGEPVIVQKVRARFAKWAAVSIGCFALNIATGIDSPWFLFPAAGMGIGLLSDYAKLWQAGYSWRDVLNRPPAPDALQGPTGIMAALPAPRAEEFGAHHPAVLQVHTDRTAIVTLMQKLSPEDRKLLPEVVDTADALYEKAVELARTLHSMDTNLNRDGLARIEERLAAVQAEPEGEERTRRVALLEQQKRAYEDLLSRRGTVADRLESSVLAMQNMRFDLLRLRSAGVGAVLNDLSQATMQARALSSDVDHAIAAATEVREAMR